MYNIVLNLKRLVLVSHGQTAFYSFSLCGHKEKRKKAVWPRETRLVPVSSLVVLLFLNNIILPITQSRLSTAQASSSFKWFDTCASTSTDHAYLYNWSAPSFYLTTAVLNDCYSEETAYTVLVYSYQASFHNAYGCLRHAHWRYRLQLPYKSHRTYLTNHMGSISHH